MQLQGQTMYLDFERIAGFFLREFTERLERDGGIELAVKLRDLESRHRADLAAVEIDHLMPAEIETLNTILAEMVESARANGGSFMEIPFRVVGDTLIIESSQPRENYIEKLCYRLESAGHVKLSATILHAVVRHLRQSLPSGGEQTAVNPFPRANTRETSRVDSPSSRAE